MAFNEELWNKMNEYKDYIASKGWLKLTKERLKKDDFKCVLCKATEKLTCHHITYQRLFSEEINDLIILCARCHSRIHRISPPIDQPKFSKQNVLSQIFAPSQKELKQTIDRVFK